MPVETVRDAPASPAAPEARREPGTPRARGPQDASQPQGSPHAATTAAPRVPAVLAEGTRSFAELLGEALARHGGTAAAVPLDVQPLGVQDAFTADGPVPGGDAVPVRHYGRHAVVGPFPARTGTDPHDRRTPPDQPGPQAPSDRPAPQARPDRPEQQAPYDRPATHDRLAPHARNDRPATHDHPAPHHHRPCARCLERRWQAVRSVAVREALELGSGTGAAGPPPYLTPFAAEAVAGVIAARLAGGGPEAGAFPAVHLVDLQTLAVRHYPLVPDPECPGCARPEPDSDEAAVLTLRPAPKLRPGGFRVRDIADYELPVQPYANPVCGSLGPSVVQDVSSTSTSATIGCFSLRSGPYLRETFWGGHADTFAESMRIGVLEGLERYAGMRPRSRHAQVRASLHALRAEGRAVVDPRVCGLYSDAFHRANPRVRPFTPDREIPWVRGWSLRDSRTVLVPEVLTYYHAPGLENRFVQESSNGCASGGALEEAAYFGLMEIVERDAFLLAWYGRAALPEIDARTSRRPAVRHMVDRLEMYGYEARFFDTRITFPIPVVTGVAVRPDGGPGRMCFGAGAGLDPEAALAGALCEIATDAVNLPGRTERDEARLRAMATDFAKVEALHDHPLAYGIPEMGDHADFLLGAPGGVRPPARSFAELYGDGPGARPVLPASDDLREDLLRCVDAVAAAGFDVVVVDQTMPEQRDLGLTTVSVIVPGLLPIDFGWTRQRALGMPRLRTALREAGLRAADLTDADFNPAPHPFP
ncbi:TOMM precursor leader peptide-binding protein [Streptomyces californicus]|uniref:TOMM precursor leader peptide-binding protein n=1 Tax=Streptomyces californicus TaxID=67351 RepID=UPI0037136A8A